MPEKRMRQASIISGTTVIVKGMEKNAHLLFKND
jgi:hypothetical protein